MSHPGVSSQTDQRSEINTGRMIMKRTVTKQPQNTRGMDVRHGAHMVIPAVYEADMRLFV